MDGKKKEEKHGCIRCDSVEEKMRIYSTEPMVFVLHMERQTLKARMKDSKHQKQILLDKIKKIVSALRNTYGGTLIIHIEGQHIGDRYLEFFDEFISYSLGSLLQDGQLYTDAFSRYWLSDLPDFDEFYDFIILHVLKGETLTTVNFKTKVSNDIEIINPTSLNIAQLLKRSKCQTKKPFLRGLKDLHESRNIELKAFHPELRKHDEMHLTNAETFVDYIWKDLKLREYITTMSKITNGGSFYVGVSENRHDLEDGYRTTTSKVVGFSVNDHEKIIKHLNTKIKENLLVLGYEGAFHDFPSDLIAYAFHKVEDSSPERFVFEISVGYINGIVFSDRDGPESYVIRNGKVKRIDTFEWLARFRDSYARDSIWY